MEGQQSREKGNFLIGNLSNKIDISINFQSKVKHTSMVVKALTNTHSNVFKIAGVNGASIKDGDECNHKPLQKNNRYTSVTLPPSKSRFPPLSGNLIKYPSQDALQTFDGTNELLLGRNIQVIFPWHKQSDILSFKLLKLNLF